MKKKLLFLIVIFIIFAAVVVGRFFILKNSAKQGRLKILTSPAANVIIDDQSVGKTPFEQPLDEGEYLVRLIPDENEASESASWSGKIEVYSNTLTFVNRELGATDVSSSGIIFSVKPMEDDVNKGHGEIEVRTEPDGSIVYLDNEEQGIAPLVLRDVPEGDHELSIYSPGFFRRSQKVKVEEGYRIFAEYKLAIDPTHKTVENLEEDEEATESARVTTETIISINETSTGWLRVRSEPSLTASEAARVEPGDTFTLLEEDSGWYKINYRAELEGWVSADYVTRKEVDEAEATDEDES